MAEGWLKDPFGRYEQRFFAAGWPTRFVRSGGVDLLDHLSDDERTVTVDDPSEDQEQDAPALPVVDDSPFAPEEPLAAIAVDDPGPVSEPESKQIGLPPFPLQGGGAAATESVAPPPSGVPPTLDGLGDPQPEPARRRGGWRAVPAWQWVFAAGVFVLVAAAMTAGFLYVSRAGPFRKPRHILNGSVTLLHQTLRGTPADLKTCGGNAAFTNVHAGAPVVVNAERKDAVGSSVLGAGDAKNVVQRGPIVLYDCTFEFRVPNVPKASFYAIRVGPYSGAAVSYDQLSKAQWTLPMRLQSSRVPGGAPQLRLIALAARARLTGQ